MAGDVFDLQLVRAEQLRDRETRQAVELPGVLDEIASQPEFVIAFDPGDAGARQIPPEAAQDLAAHDDLLAELLARSRRVIEPGDLPKILEIAVQDQPIGPFRPQETPQQGERLLVVKRHMEIVSDDHHEPATAPFAGLGHSNLAAGLGDIGSLCPPQSPPGILAAASNVSGFGWTLRLQTGVSMVCRACVYPRPKSPKSTRMAENRYFMRRFTISRSLPGRPPNPPEVHRGWTLRTHRRRLRLPP